MSPLVLGWSQATWSLIASIAGLAFSIGALFT